MCEQTEISYLDGDVVWVKLGACWWPGQVTGFHNLPEDIQSEFKKKPLIAAVKFFQEDTYEFVKNYQQIYKYNCTLKDDFIKKGLDKYRTKSKDGSRYMDKFPGDVEMAEKLTGGDPDILNHDKFSPEEKPNISALFGEKKVSRKKRDRDDTHRRSDGIEIVRKITHPRFLRESDHEVRIRQQPSSLPSTPHSTGSPQYPCHLCNFTSSRVNVIICHIKSHRSGNSSAARSKVKSYSQHGNRISDTETPKRKYIRKEKSQSGKNKVNSESGKRKQAKQIEKASKKKKTDPKIRDTILADWEDESDEDMSLNQIKPLDVSSIIDTPKKSQSNFELVEEPNQKHKLTGDTNEIIEETEKLLRETEKLTSIDIIEDTLTSDIHVGKSFKSSGSENQSDSQREFKAHDSAGTDSTAKPRKEKEISNLENENKRTASDRDDKKSLLSCFDFHEEEPSIPPVRKKARAFHQKKEIIKEFEMSQAMKTEQENETDNADNKATGVAGNNANLKSDEQLLVNVEDSKETEKNDKVMDESIELDSEAKLIKNEVKESAVPEESTEKRVGNSENQLESLEIFQAEKEQGESRNIENTSTGIEKKSEVNITPDVTVDNDKPSWEKNELSLKNKSTDDQQPLSTDTAMESSIAETIEHTPTKESDETLSERFTTETEDETVSESAETLPEQSENSDADMVDPDQASNSDAMGILLTGEEAVNVTPKVVKKRRGRPRKSLESIHKSTSGSESPRMRDSKMIDSIFEKVEAERKVSESDSERSHSGRKRKPNKKYFEPDTYVQDAEQRASKTDESQSESDDRVSEMVKSRSRKSKRPVRSNKTNKTENNERVEERELEIPLDTTDTTVSDIQLSETELKDNLAESNVRKGEPFMELVAKVTDNQPLEISETLEELKEAEFTSKDSAMLGPSSDDRLLVIENTANKIEKIVMEGEKSEDTEMKSHDTLLDRDILNEGDLKDLCTESASTVRLDITPNKEDPHSQQADITKTPVDFLPPKKSQIKKFELSQMDFFDAAPSNKNIVETKSNNGQEKSEETSKANTKIDSNAEFIGTLTQQEKLFAESSETGVEVTDTTKYVVRREEEKLPQSEENLPSCQEEEICEADIKTSEKQESQLKPETTTEQLSKDTTSALQDRQDLKRTSMQTRYKGKFTPETGAKSKRDKELFLEEKSTNTFQEAFLKTLHMDKKKSTTDDSEMTVGKGKKGKRSVKRKLEELDNTSVTLGIIPDTKSDSLNENLEMPKIVSDIQDHESNSELSVLSNIQDIEAKEYEDPATDTKDDDTVPSVPQKGDKVASTSAELDTPSKSLTRTPTTADSPMSFTLNVQKLDESPKTPAPTSTLAPTTDVTVPVKKREMPRVIENVALKEPMQILKSKLLDKFPQKGVKHKLEADHVKKGEQRNSPKAKIMKIESVSPNSKMKTGQKVTSPRLSLTKKLQVLKAEEAETAAMMEAQSTELSKVSIKSSKPSTVASTPEKYIQQSSQSLADMELDINSMPFVLSEDVLTPENIEQMPVVISSILPTSSAIPATLSFTPTTQIMSSTQTQFKLGNESTAEVSSPTKKKSGTPAILKNKNKAKPTITSIKTLVPPLTGGVKGLKFQSAAPASKTPPLLTQKGSPGKYVVVQTAGGQQLRYSVQGKSSAQPKIAIPTGKSAGNAQVVQQGGKVVILTSPQSGQTKMLPLNISKPLSGKVQRIMTSKGQVFCPISPQGIITSKTMIAPKTDGISPTTSKLAPGHKIINTQGIITSKGVLTPIPGTIAKTALLGTLSQGILTKGGIYTPISASTLGGKTVISPKGLVTKGTTILSSQNLGTPKTILTPISQTIGGKTILSTQGIVSSKATVLTPITGQQVKAIAAKSPAKGKVHYQSVQQKVQLPVLHKSQKVQLSSSGQGKSGPSKSSGNTVVLQNASSTQKTIQHGKKITKQAGLQQGATAQNISSQSSAQQAVSTVSHVQQKGKSTSASSAQKVIIPRGSGGGGRQSKPQQKTIAQKMHEPGIGVVQNIQSKQSVCPSATGLHSVPNVSKMTTQQKQSIGSGTATKATARCHATIKTAQQPKNLLNIAINSLTTTTNTTTTSTTTTGVNTNLSTTLSLPPLEPIASEKKSKMDNLAPDTVRKEQPKAEKFSIDGEKVDEPKLTAQPQIMALPTESSDGTQTYVLVTIDEQGQIQPLDNNTLMSLEGTTQNPDGTRTIYIDPSSLGDAGTLDNIVLQFDNGVLPSAQPSVTESTQAIISESFPTTEVIQTSNQDILAAALANTDFQQEIGLPENPTVSVMPAGLTQTSLINQTILQSTIIPPTEPISSPSVLETSLTLNQPIMTPLEVPSNMPIQSDSTPTPTPSSTSTPASASAPVVKTIPSSLELPITITNPNISYIGTGEAQIQIPGNSMPDIGEIMENPSAVGIVETQMPPSTQYLVLPNLEDHVTDTRATHVESGAISMPSASYSVSIPNNIVLDNPQVQTTPSMPIIDDTYSEHAQFDTSIQPSMESGQTFVDVPVSEMLVPKATSTSIVQAHDVTVTSEMIVSHSIVASSQNPTALTNETSIINEEQVESGPLCEVYSSQQVPITSEELILQQAIVQKDNASNAVQVERTEQIGNDEQTREPTTSSMPIIDDTSIVTSESNVKVGSEEQVSFDVSDSNGIEAVALQESTITDKVKQLTFTEQPPSFKVDSPMANEQAAATSNEVQPALATTQVLPTESLNRVVQQNIDTDKTIQSTGYAADAMKQSDSCQGDEPSSQGESGLVDRNLELHFQEANAVETSHEAPSQSYEQFGISMTTDSPDLPSQSATKSENSREPSQSITYEPMETDEEAVITEPPSQSFEHSKLNEASQSYEITAEASTSAPTQSFNEVMQSQEDRVTIDETIDDQTFPTQSYEVGKAENISENLETDPEISQEGNIPSQSNDIGNDGIGTSSVSTNNSGLNEDETASSSYVPETPENQERDQDQESAISTSSYEIPPCEELNIASSSVIPDTSVRAEHTSIHDNGVPEIPTSSYNLNPDITSTHVDSLPTSSYEDQVVVEQNVSTSYEVPISMPGLEETCSQNFVTESTDHRNEPSSYYTHHQEVTASYYESVEQETNSRLEEDPREEVTPSYYEGNPQEEASQSYFNPEEATTSYSSHNVSPSYYDPRPESEASQSYYSTEDIEKTEQSSSQNIEASQSFYQEQSDELKMRQRGEATPTYTERYPVDYTLDNSPIERHDLVESSVSATRPTER